MASVDHLNNSVFHERNQYHPKPFSIGVYSESVGMLSGESDNKRKRKKKTKRSANQASHLITGECQSNDDVRHQPQNPRSWHHHPISGRCDYRNDNSSRGAVPISGQYTSKNENRPDRRISFVPRQVGLKENVRKKELVVFKPKQLQIGSLRKGVVTSLSKYTLFIQFNEDLEAVEIISKKIEAFLAMYQARISRPRPGFICAVMMEGYWLRATIINYYEMELVDVGKTHTYSDPEGNLLYDLYFIDHCKELTDQPVLTLKISVESLTNGTRKFLTKYHLEQFESQLVGKTFIFEVGPSSGPGSLSINILPYQSLNGVDMFKPGTVTSLVAVDPPPTGYVTLNHVKKLKTGLFCGSMDTWREVISEVSKMGDIYADDKSLRVNAVKMKTGQFVVWRTQFKGQERFRRVIVTGESDDGFYYEGLLIDCGEILKLRISDSYIMVKPFDKYPPQSMMFTFACTEPVIQRKNVSIKVHIKSCNADGSLIVDHYEMTSTDQEVVGMAKVMLSSEDNWNSSSEMNNVPPCGVDDQVVPRVAETRVSSAASSSECKLSVIYEESIESFAVHELECSQGSQTTLPSINEDDDFEPSFYELEHDTNYPNHQLGGFGDEIADMVDRHNVKAVLEGIIQAVVESLKSDEIKVDETLLDLERPIERCNLLDDIGVVPALVVHLMDLGPDESPSSITNSNVDILTGSGQVEFQERDISAVLNTGGDLINC